MNEMLKIFLQEIPGILFEAIAVAAVIGILLAAVFYAKRPFGKFYWLIAGMLIYMLIWRILIQIISSRYAEILLFPAVIASVYACFKVPEMIGPYIKKYIPLKIWRFMPYALVAGLSIACFCKAVHTNPYDMIGTTAKIIQQDRADIPPEKIMILSEERSIQLQYYTKLPTRKSPPIMQQDGTPDAKKIYAVIRKYRKGREILYFVNQEKANRPPILLKKNNKNDPRWEFLGQQYIDRRRKKMLRVYRYSVKK